MMKRASLVSIFLLVFFAFTASIAVAQKPAKRQMEGMNGPMGISGMASGGRHCVGPSGSNTHNLGSLPSGTRLNITFMSDFDPVAGVTVMQMGSDAPEGRARVTYAFDDDSGGNLEPELRFNLTHQGQAVLHVGKYSPDRTSGCYWYKVEIQTP